MKLDDGYGNNVYFLPSTLNKLEWHVFTGYTEGDELPVMENEIPEEVRLAMLTAKIVLSR